MNDFIKKTVVSLFTVAVICTIAITHGLPVLAAATFQNPPVVQATHDRITVTYSVTAATQADASDTTPLQLSVQKAGQPKVNEGSPKTLQSDLEFQPSASGWPRTGTIYWAASGNNIEPSTSYNWFITKPDGTIVGQGSVTTGSYQNIPGSNQVTVTPGSVSGCVEGSGEYCLLEPLPIGNNGQILDKIDPDQSFGTYLNTIVKILIGIVGVLAVVVIVLGGIQYMTTDAFSRKEGGKEMITRSIFGLLIALGSVLLLNTINPQLGAIVFSIDEAVVAIDPSHIETNEGQNPATLRACGGFTPSQAGQAWYNDTVERTALQDGGWISVVGANCSTYGQAGSCTSVAKYTNAQITEFKDLATKIKTACPSCQLQITGGTECWKHQSHDIGKSIFDAEDTTIVNYVVTDAHKQTRACAVGWPVHANEGRAKCNQGGVGAWQYIIEGFAFIDEGNHFHVCKGHCD